MNAFGVNIDSELVAGALSINKTSTYNLTVEAQNLTGLENPNSSAQLSVWLKEKGVELSNLQKATVSDLLTTELPSDVKRVLEIRQELSKTSVKKYEAMVSAMGIDGRVRGLLQFYGANRTGRWAGRLVQVQNLPRNYIETLDYAREIVKSHNTEFLKFVYDNFQILYHNLLEQLLFLQ